MANQKSENKENHIGKKFQKRTSSIILSLVIGLVVISFLFSSYSSVRGTPDTVMKVGHLPIKMAEFQRVYSRIVNQYSKFMGGKSLTSKQIKSFGIRRMALNQLQNEKLSVILSEKLGLYPSPLQIKKEIKKMPYFQTEKKFDINRYKQILRLNNISPSSHEDSVRTSLKLQKLQSIIDGAPLSGEFVKEVVSLKSKKVKISGVQFKKNTLKKHIKITKKEIRDYLAKPENMTNIKNTFEAEKSNLNKPEQVKARHILMMTAGKDAEKVKKDIKKLSKKVTSANFIKMAKKHTEDPSGKNNGGKLGWFSKGRMDPAFEKAAFSQKIGTVSRPIKTNFGYHLIMVEAKKKAVIATFDQNKDMLVKKNLQANKKDDLKKLVANLTQEIKTNLEKKRFKRLEKMKEKYGFKFEKNIVINRLDGTSKFQIDANQINSIFKNNYPKPEVITFDNIINILSVLVETPLKKELDSDLSIEKEMTAQSFMLSKKFYQDVIMSMRKNTKIKDYNLLRD